MKIPNIEWYRFMGGIRYRESIMSIFESDLPAEKKIFLWQSQLPISSCGYVNQLRMPSTLSVKSPPQHLKFVPTVCVIPLKYSKCIICSVWQIVVRLSRFYILLFFFLFSERIMEVFLQSIQNLIAFTLLRTVKVCISKSVTLISHFGILGL